MTVRVVGGDMLVELPKLASEGFLAHACITDPPYELGFMGKKWDRTGIAFCPDTWRTVRDVMRPGAFLVAFASTRGYHRMVCAIEDAGFVIHPMLGWLYGSGFPKATRFNQPELEGWRYGLQALKPALEPICLAQKPLVGTGSANWAEHGCGGLNVNACRVATTDVLLVKGRSEEAAKSKGIYGDSRSQPTRVGEGQDIGRWPANLLHDGSDEVEAAFAAFGSDKGVAAPVTRRGSDKFRNTYGAFAGNTDERGSTFQGDTGTASRFFFSAKAGADDRAGSGHPTVKPTSLMRWLVKLVTPTGGTILDPFAGTGSTGLAADQLGFDSVLIEKHPQYAADARRKISADAPLFGSVA